MLPGLAAISKQQTRRRLSDQFQLQSGSCTTSGNCFESPNYPSDYGSDQACSIKVLSVGAGEKLGSIAFNTESGYDKLTIGGTAYSGTLGPGGVAVSNNDVMTWSSDGTSVETGFQVCLLPTCAQNNVHARAHDTASATFVGQESFPRVCSCNSNARD